MGFFSAFKQRREQKEHEDALRILNPYVLIPEGRKMTWMRWEFLAEAETAGLFPRQNGLPVPVTKDECLALNGGNLPEYWGEVQYAWRSEDQKQAFHAENPHLFKPQRIEEPPSMPRRNLNDEYPTEEQIEKMFAAACRANREDGVAQVLKKRAQERKARQAGSQQPTPATSAPVEKHYLTHEQLMRLVEESSTRDLTDEEVSLLASRLCWRDEAARLQWHREERIQPTSESEIS